MVDTQETTMRCANARTTGCQKLVFEGTRYCEDCLVEEARKLDELLSDPELETDTQPEDGSLPHFNRFIAGDR